MQRRPTTSKGRDVEYLSYDQIGEMLGVSRWTVMRMVQEGLPAVKLRSGAKATVRVKASDLEEYLAARRVNA